MVVVLPYFEYAFWLISKSDEILRHFKFNLISTFFSAYFAKIDVLGYKRDVQDCPRCDHCDQQVSYKIGVEKKNPAFILSTEVNFPNGWRVLKILLFNCLIFSIIVWWKIWQERMTSLGDQLSGLSVQSQM